MIKLRKLICLFLISPFLIANPNIEEVVTTGSIIKNPEVDSSPVDVITKEGFENFNISSFAEISKYITSASGSHFQTNALEGVDQGMASITLRGLDHSATLLLLNSKRHTFAGTPSNQGEGYIDVNIVPEIAIKQIEILKEGATSLYGSDAVAGVVNVLTQKDYEGLKIQVKNFKTTNYGQSDKALGLLFGSTYENVNYVIGLNVLDRSALSASEIPGIAETGVSFLGKSFLISADDIVSVQNPGEVEAEEVGQFQLADFANSRGLQPIGQSMLVETPASGPAIVANPFENGFGSLVQGALESSNVNVVQELVDMIETQRAYEVNSKAISGVDDMLRFISQNL